MTSQLTLDGTEVETAPVKCTAQQTAHEAVELAESLLTAEETRPPSREHWVRMAGCYECRSAAWQVAAASERDPHGLAVRAMGLAANADLEKARMLRGRLAVTG